MFAGIISKDQSTSVWGDVDTILFALAPFSLGKPRDVWADGSQLLMQIATRTGADTAVIYQHPESGVAVAFWGRLDNRPDLISELEAANGACDNELIALAWLKWGELSTEKLLGDFAFAVASPKSGTVFLARDVMGVKPLFYRSDENGIFFASSLSAFKPLRLGKLTQCKQWTAQFLVSESWSLTETAYVEVKKLPAAHAMLIQADGKVKITKYHTFSAESPIENRRNPEYLDHYRSAWQAAVHTRIPSCGDFVAENSGGLDSASVISEIARQLEKSERDRLHTFGFCKDSLEPEFIMETAMRWGLSQNHLNSGPHENVEDKIHLRALAVLGCPQEFSMATHCAPIYRYCQQNRLATLFSGFGGDEACTSYATHKIRIELFQKRRFSALWNILPGNVFARLARLALTAKRSRFQDEYHPLMYKAFNQHWQHHFLNADAVKEFNLERIYIEGSRLGEDAASINENVIKKLALPFLAARLENCSLMAASYGVDYVWPLLDQRLIQQWLSTPTIWKAGKGGIGRYLHRAAVDGVCPDKITWFPGKDFGVSAMPIQSPRQEFIKIQEILEALPSGLAALVDTDRLRLATNQALINEWGPHETKSSMLLLTGYNLRLLANWVES